MNPILFKKCYRIPYCLYSKCYFLYFGKRFRSPDMFQFSFCLSRFCVNQCQGLGYCAPQAVRQEVLPLPLDFPANTDIARLIPFFPPYMTSLQYYYQFDYTFTVQPSPFGIRLFANEAVIYTKQKLEKAGMHKLQVTADMLYVGGTLACRTVFTVYIDVSRFSF